MSDASGNRTFGVVIPNWNGAAFIERCLGSVLAAVRRSGRAMEIIITDDASGDGSADIIAKSFPSVKLIRWDANVGFGEAVGRGMAAATADWIFLLNNDLALKEDFCERLISVLDAQPDPKRVFAIGARTLDWATGAPNHGGQLARWKDGLIMQEPFESDDAAEAGFFQAGACLINRNKFNELGGFAPIFAPGYWEDYDLAWQARRRGWSVMYDPRANAYHLGKGSMAERLGDYGLSLTLKRNHLLFVWANLSDTGLLAKHFASLPKLVLKKEGLAGWGRALIAALERLPAVLKLRRTRMGVCGKSDRELMEQR
ncbi:glycosyltransferase family 2 protein [bacterium]|nr:glycosyltransferase family 2 protein [bacterium]